MLTVPVPILNFDNGRRQHTHHRSQRRPRQSLRIPISLLPHSETHQGIFTVRNLSSAAEIQEALALSSTHHHVTPLNLSSLASIRATASSLTKRISSGEIPPIRALVLNAAIQQVDGKTYTTDGYESHFAVNYLANFLFVLLMLGSMDKERGRIVCISTALHDSTHWMNRSTFSDGEREMFKNMESVVDGGEDGTDEEKAGMQRYATSKFLLVMFMYALQRRLDSSPTLFKVSIFSLDPGGMGGAELTKRGSAASKFLWTYIMPAIQSWAVYFWPNGFLRTNDKSASDVLRACFDTEVVGRYPKGVFMNGGQIGMASWEARDEGKQGILWDGSVMLVGLGEGDTVLENWK
ncbi:hypothetical protein BKA65DRAFT_255925 [Rhexocercosporidium sp. MPI-PUGE-AT-0058]|nr:hypothetical protein BKA65DRAFT_255925 [Rhexocercosporidium sp. MPI-PUGE-AT-0058]